ncbi:hypothetical protein GCM10010497_48470 [Streptomyces cinereoruber]|uniref:Uncharacterized protein n=1 Tax=Streptomyces cinereoruber TaxID=67260 RepID=A0AAV4KRE0_9ACTN|nr:hypothetical protein GCM10010497_48470 [Streptomyces cinereoruber]
MSILALSGRARLVSGVRPVGEAGTGGIGGLHRDPRPGDRVVASRDPAHRSFDVVEDGRADLTQKRGPRPA